MKRRDFLKTLGMTAAAASIPSVLRAQTKPGTQELASPYVPLAYDSDDIDAKLFKPVTAIVIGAGNRGTRYAGYAASYSGSFNIVGVSDINEFRKNRMAERFNIAPEHRFGDWSEVFTVPRFADAVIISTPDDLHHKPCMQALEMGYDVLLEKPIAQNEQECLDILQQARKYGRIVAVCHVLRYAPYFIAMRNLIKSGEVGEVVSIQHIEPIGALHMAHSYVRGNWHNSKETTPIILAKSCHDLDILPWMTGKKYSDISAFGDLMFYKRKNAPEGSTERCLDCAVEKDCYFSAKRIYLDKKSYIYVFDFKSEGAARDREITEYLRTTDYGRCVFRMNNDQCDHYVMNAKFTDGSTLAFSMEALTSYEGRHTRIMGTKGDIVGDMRTFTHTDFLTGSKSVWSTEKTDGHGGGDARLVRDFIKAVSAKDESIITSSIEASVESHIAGFKAEKSRLSGKTEKM
jgi:predicted dehydrogenase